MDTVKAGALLCVDTGTFSDYEVTGLFVVLKDFVPQTELKMYLTRNPEQAQPYSFREDQFLTWLITKGLLMETYYGTLHLGGHGRYDEVCFTPCVNK